MYRPYRPKMIHATSRDDQTHDNKKSPEAGTSGLSGKREEEGIQLSGTLQFGAFQLRHSQPPEPSGTTMFFCAFPENPRSRIHIPHDCRIRKPICASPSSRALRGLDHSHPQAHAHEPARTPHSPAGIVSPHISPVAAQRPLHGGAEATIGYARIFAAQPADQFLKEWIGAGMRPPRVTKASQLVWFTGMIGA